MQLSVSTEINLVLEHALKISASQQRFFVGVEHMFLALMGHIEELPEPFRESHADALMKTAREVSRTAWKGEAEMPAGEIFHTPRCINTIQQATKLAARRGKSNADASFLLLALLADAYSAPSRAMDSLNLNRGNCIKALIAALDDPRTASASARKPSVPQKQYQSKANEAPASTGAAYSPDMAGAKANGADLESLTRDLTKMGQEGKLQPAIGRDEEIFEILQILARKSKNNVMLVGEAGVGKTQVVEGIAYNLAHNDEMQNLLPPFRILELNISALMAGTQYRGAFEERILALLNQLKNSPDTVLFIDEAHLIMGAGSTDGDGMDLANLLKPALARGEIRCIGATTFKEYRKFVERDPAIERRFQMVRLEELSEEDTYKVLQSILPSLQRHHNVRISDRAVKSAVQLSIRYMPNRCLPDKAIDVLDQACARFRLKMLAAYNKAGMAENTMPPVKEIGVTPHEIRKVISRMIAVPIEEMTAEERLRLGAIEREIRARLIGQEEAVVKSVSAIKKSRAGLSDPNRPFAVLLFLGPSGVGKTQLAKLLATYLFGAPNHLITFDMSEYIEEHSLSRLLGAPPGYVGSEEEGRLTGAVKNTPFSILLFDEIEKAHPRIFDIFLPIFDEGRLKDSHGREVNFKNCIIILTSNIGAEILSHANAPDMRSALIEELRQHFRPEFINRIDDIIPFYPLVAEDIRSILNLEIDSVRKRLRDKKFHLHVYQRAFQYLAEKGYRPEFGARELRRVVDKEITTPLSEMILNHKFQAGDTIAVMEENGKLVFNKETPSPVKPEQGKQAHS